MTRSEQKVSKIFMGAAGSGKTQALLHEVLQTLERKESVVLFTEEQPLLPALKESVEKLEGVNFELLDFSNVETFEQYALTLTPDFDLTPYTNDLLLAGHIDRIYQTFLNLLESYGDSPLSLNSQRLLELASKAVFATPGRSFYHLFQFLTEESLRKSWIQSLSNREYSLLTASELELLREINSDETAGLNRLISEMSSLFQDFRIKTLLSNSLSSNHNMERFSPTKGLTVIYLPSSFSSAFQDQLVHLLTLHCQFVQKSSYDHSFTLAYDEIFRYTKTLKYLKTNLHQLFRLDIRILCTVFSYQNASTFLTELLPYQPHLVCLSKPNYREASRFNALLESKDLNNLLWTPYHAYVIKPNNIAIEYYEIPCLSRTYSY